MTTEISLLRTVMFQLDLSLYLFNSLYISKQQLQQNKKKIFSDGFVFFCTMLIIAVLLTMAISHRITRPIHTLLNHLNQVETGQLGEVIKQVESNEIGDVQKGFNGKIPHTDYRITDAGRKALADYWSALDQIRTSSGEGGSS